MLSILHFKLLLNSDLYKVGPLKVTSLFSLGYFPERIGGIPSILKRHKAQVESIKPAELLLVPYTCFISTTMFLFGPPSLLTACPLSTASQFLAERHFY